MPSRFEEGNDDQLFGQLVGEDVGARLERHMH